MGYLKYITMALIAIIVVLSSLLVLDNIDPIKKEGQNKKDALASPNSATGITGCYSKEACVEYCKKPENYRRCFNFIISKYTAREFFPFPPGNCQNKEECNEYCEISMDECVYYKAYARETVKNAFEGNFSDIIIPVNYSAKEAGFYKITSSHFMDYNINKEFETFKKMGINSYSFWVEVSYILGDVAYSINTSNYGKTWPGYFKEWKSRAAYLIGKAHLSKLKFVYFVSPTDWDSWESPQYPEPASKGMIDDWVRNYTQAIRVVSQFAQSAHVDVLVIGANPAIVKVKREASNEYLNSVYERLLQEMLKEARKWYKGEIGLEFGSDVSGSILEFKKVPEIGKFDYVFFATGAKHLESDDPAKWTSKALNVIEEAKKIAEKNSAKGIILEFEFGETDSRKPYEECESVKPYPLEARKMFYNELINKTKEHVIGYMPITTPLFACDSENLLQVTREWYERL